MFDFKKTIKHDENYKDGWNDGLEAARLAISRGMHNSDSMSIIEEILTNLQRNGNDNG